MNISNLRKTIQHLERAGQDSFYLDMEDHIGWEEPLSLPAFWQCSGVSCLDYIIAIARRLAGPIYWFDCADTNYIPDGYGLWQRGLPWDQCFRIKSTSQHDLIWALAEVLSYESRAVLLIHVPIDHAHKCMRKLRLAAEKSHSLVVFMNQQEALPMMDARLTFQPMKQGSYDQRHLHIMRHYHRRLPPKNWCHEVKIVQPFIHLAAAVGT